MAKPTVLVNAGHRFTVGEGESYERLLTFAMAVAYRDAMRTAGLVCDWLQEVDGDALPTFTQGTRHDGWRQGVQWIANHPGMVVILDLHFQEGGDRGLFAIIPNRGTLRNGDDVVAQPGQYDHWQYNTLDRQLGREVVNRISTATGLPQCTSNVRETGLMGEEQTGVGSSGYRLATFAWTSPFYDRAIRLVIEHGALDFASDRAIIEQPGFDQDCARAAAQAVNAVFP